jgi:hypothetical protein
MPKFNVEYTTEKSATEAFAQVKTFFAGENDIRRFDPKLACSFDEKLLKCTVKGSQFSALVDVIEHKAGAKLNIQVEIPFLLTPLKGKIEDSLKKSLSKFIG